MATVYLGVGSNIQRERYITAGLDALERMFDTLRHSSVYDCAAIGFDGQPFLNLAVCVETELAIAELAAALRHLEHAHGRPQNATRFSARQLDIDILTFGDSTGEFGGITLPREEILENAFVLRPLAELAPHEPHPVDGRCYDELWRTYDQQSQPVRRVDFSWHGRTISHAE